MGDTQPLWYSTLPIHDYSACTKLSDIIAWGDLQFKCPLAHSWRPSVTQLPAVPINLVSDRFPDVVYNTESNVFRYIHWS
jgi:hypothetical protein